MKYILLIMLAGCMATPDIKSIPPGDTKAVEWFLSLNVRYWRDNGIQDEYKEPKQTLRDGFGDCDDYAMLTYTIVNQWPSYRAELYKPRPSHVITKVIGPGVVGYFDNDIWHKGEYENKNKAEE